MGGRQRVISGDRRRVPELSDVGTYIKKESTEGGVEGPQQRGKCL